MVEQTIETLVILRPHRAHYDVNVMNPKNASDAIIEYSICVVRHVFSYNLR